MLAVEKGLPTVAVQPEQRQRRPRQAYGAQPLSPVHTPTESYLPAQPVTTAPVLAPMICPPGLPGQPGLPGEPGGNTEMLSHYVEF